MGAAGEPGLREFPLKPRSWDRPVWQHSNVSDVVVTAGEADPALDKRLNDELDAFNTEATSGITPARKLTVRVERSSEIVAGVSGWTWGEAAGISLMWVQSDLRGTGVGSEAISAFEAVARERGCTHVFVTSFTFQAPAFYQHLGYREIFRWDSVPTSGMDDVHMRKDL